MWKCLLAQLVHQNPLHQQVQHLEVEPHVVEVDGQLVVFHIDPLSFETKHLLYQGQKGTKAHMVHHWPFALDWWMVKGFCILCLE